MPWDYVLALKGNQGTLHDAAVDYVEQNMKNDFADVEVRRHTTTETGHGRKETRTYVQMPAPKSLAGFGRWAGLTTIGVAILICTRNGKETVDIRYFISSLELGVKRFANAVRSHWAIENTCHWCLDITYREDESRIREKKLRENFAWLNRFTLSLLKQHSNKKSVAMNRRRCGWNDDVLLQILIGEKT
jgi:predicted transposase YbfD/YdcC